VVPGVTEEQWVCLRALQQQMRVALPGEPHPAKHQDLRIRIVNASTGELIRELTLNPARSYQPIGKPSGWPEKPPRPIRGFAVSSMS
jgi:hypothetical protein